MAIVIVKQACTLQLEQSWTAATGAASTKIVIGNLDIIPQERGGFNQQVVQYQFLAQQNNPSGQLTELYAAVNALLPSTVPVKSFFFNNIPDRDFTLDIGKGYAIKTLDDPRAYFDYNNINNNFVISQIDTEYFTDTVYDTAQGIIITNSSKLNY